MHSPIPHEDPDRSIIDLSENEIDRYMRRKTERLEKELSLIKDSRRQLDEMRASFPDISSVLAPSDIEPYDDEHDFIQNEDVMELSRDFIDFDHVFLNMVTEVALEAMTTVLK